ncbi:MAG: hypothetical protein V3R26_04185, partial [Hyphomicrobium sp.]
MIYCAFSDSWWKWADGGCPPHQVSCATLAPGFELGMQAGGAIDSTGRQHPAITVTVDILGNDSHHECRE